MRLTTVADAETAAQRAADVVARMAAEAVDARGVFHLALAGGSSPKRCHEMLAELDVDWSRVHLWESDQRAVGPDDDDSNFKMIREPPPDRISFTFETAHAARRTLLLAAGASKADAMRAVLEAAFPHVPASLLRFGRLEVIVDDAAAPSPTQRPAP